MNEFLAALSIGVGTGAIYAMLALGFVIIFKATQVISFAQPAFMMAGAILVSYLAPRWGFAVGVVVGTLVIGGLALAVERLVIRPMVGKAVFVVAIVTIGIDIIVRVIAGAFVGVDPRTVGDPWGLDTLSVGGVPVQVRHLAALAATGAVVVALYLFFRFTRVGVAMRAASLDQEAAMAQGVSVGAVFALSWGLAGALAALAGVFAAAGNAIDNNLWIVGFAALPVIILGGLDSLMGAVVGGLLIGVAQSVVASHHTDLFPFWDRNIGEIMPYLVLLLVLLIRPHGLFGTKEVERV